MKNKIIMIAATVFFAGLILTGVAFGLVGFNFREFNTGESYKMYTYECNEPVKDIHIDETDAGMIIRSDDVNKVTVRYYERRGEEYQISENDNQLNIEKKKQFVWRFIDINLEEHKLEVVVPEDFNGTLNISQEDGSVRIMDMKSGNIAVDSKCGSVTVKNVETNAVKISGKDGSIKINQMKAASVIDMTNKCGSIQLEEVTADNITVSSSDGNITLDGVIAQNTVTVNNICGSIRFNTLDAGKMIQIGNADGSIRGTIAGTKEDFLIQSSVEDGNNSLGNTTTGDKTLNVTNKCGSIDIDFTGKNE